MFSEMPRLAGGKRARTWGDNNNNNSISSPYPHSSSDHVSSAASAPAPLLDLLQNVPTVDLLRWLPASVATEASDAAAHGSAPFDCLFDTQLATQVGSRPEDAMIRQTMAKLGATTRSLAPADACLFQLLLTGALSTPETTAASRIPLDASKRADDRATVADTRSASPLGTHIPAEVQPLSTSSSLPDGAPTTTTSTDAAAQSTETITVAARAPMKGILKHVPPPVSLSEAGVATTEQAPHIRDDDLSVVGKLLYVIMQTSTVGATMQSGASYQALQARRGSSSDVAGTPLSWSAWDEAPKRGRSDAAPGGVTVAWCDASSPAWWDASRSPVSSTSCCGLSTTSSRSLCASPFTATSGGAAGARLWLSPTTIALVESSAQVRARLRWTTALDPVLSAVLDRHSHRAGASGWSAASRPRDALSVFDSTPPHPKQRRQQVFHVDEEEVEDEAVRRLFARKPYGSSGNRSPLTNRERHTSDGGGGGGADTINTNTTYTSNTGTGVFLTTPPPLGIAPVSPNSTLASVQRTLAQSLLFTPQYTPEECAMLHVAIHHCCVGVPDPYLLTWRVQGAGGTADVGDADRMESDDDNDESKDGKASRHQHHYSGHKRLFTEDASPSHALKPRCPMMALHPQFLAHLDTTHDAKRGTPKSAKRESSPIGASSPPPLPSSRLCQRNVGALLARACELGTLFVRLEALCHVAAQPSQRGRIGSYGTCAVDGLRAVLRILQRHAATTMVTMARKAAGQTNSGRAESALHGLSFNAVLEAFFQIERTLGATLRELATVFQVSAAFDWDVSEALADLSSAALLSKLYVQACHGGDAPFRSRSQGGRDDDDDDDDDGDDGAHDGKEERYSGSHGTSERATAQPSLQRGLRDVVSFLFCCTLSPLNRFLHRWLTMGDRRDPLDEFFIVPSYGATAGGYEVDPSPHRLPCFISEETANVFVQAGLSMRVLRLAATHVVQSAGAVFHGLIRQDAVADNSDSYGGGLHGIEDAAAAREDAGLLYDAVGQFLSAVTGHFVPLTTGAEVPQRPSASAAAGGPPVLSPLAAHGALAHWRLFFTDCDAVLVRALEAGLDGDEARNSANENEGDAVEEHDSGDDDAEGTAAVTAAMATAVTRTTGPLRLTRDALRQHARPATVSTTATPAATVGAVVVMRGPASHITIPMYSVMSSRVPAGRGERGKDARAPNITTTTHSSAASSSLSSWGGDRRRVWSFMSHGSVHSTSSTALSSGATSALYGAIKAEHRLHAHAAAQDTSENDPRTVAAPGSRRQLQQAYEDSLRAHARLARLAEWKAQRQALWIDRAKAIRDVVAIVQDAYAQQPPREDEEGAKWRLSGVVQPCLQVPPPRRAVVVLYPRRDRPRVAHAGVTVAFHEESAEKTSEAAPPSTVASTRANEESETPPVESTTPTNIDALSVTPVEIAISPVDAALTASTALTHNADAAPPQQADGMCHAPEVTTPSRSASQAPAHADDDDDHSASWLSPQTADVPRTPVAQTVNPNMSSAYADRIDPTTAQSPARTPFGSPGLTREAVGGRDVTAVLAALWPDDDGDEEASQRATDARRSPALPLLEPEGRFDSLGFAQPAEYFVISDINDDEYLEQRTLDGLQQQRRRREKLDRMTRARAGLEAWRAQTINEQLEARALIDLPAYREACQHAAEQLFLHTQDAPQVTTAAAVNENSDDDEEEASIEGASVVDVFAAIAVDEGFRQTWWRDAPRNDANPDRHIWSVHGAGAGGPRHTPNARDGPHDDYFQNPLVHNTTQQLIRDSVFVDPLCRVNSVAAHGETSLQAPSPPPLPLTSLCLSRVERQLLAQCPRYYAHVAGLAARYCTHKALQLSLLPPHGLQFQWVSSCLDVCLLQHAPTAATLTEWWQQQLRARLENSEAPTAPRSSTEALLDSLNLVFRDAWERLRAVAGAPAAVHLPTAATRVQWTLRHTSTTGATPASRTFLSTHTATTTATTATTATTESAAEESAALDALLLFLSDIQLESTSATRDSPTVASEVSMLSPDANLLADYGGLFSTLLFWKVVDHMLYTLYQDGLASQEKAVFFLCNTARAIMHTLQERFWERLQMIASHYRRGSVDMFGDEALYSYDSLEAFRQQHSGFVAECRFTAMLSGHFRLCQVHLRALLQSLAAAQVAIRRATRRVREASTEPGRREQRRRVRDVVSQQLRQFVATVELLVGEVRAVQDVCAMHAIPRATRTHDSVHDGTAQTEDEESDGDDVDDDAGSVFGERWYNATDSATIQGDTERDRQQAWRSRTQYVTRVLDSLEDIVRAVSDRW